MASTSIDGSDRHAVLGVGPHLLAVDASCVQEMFVLGATTRPPGAPAHQRGVTLLRGRTLPVLDLAACLSVRCASVELAEMLALLDARQKDHEGWLAELEASVREARPFTLATDPRKCRFGQWYYAYQCADGVVRAELSRFEQPHAEIHALAKRIEPLVRDGRAAEALALVDRARETTLAELLRVFARTKATLTAQHKVIGVTVRLGERDVVLAVDRAEAVTRLEPLSSSDDPVRDGTLQLPLVARMARWKERPEPVLVLDVPRLHALG